MIEADAAIEIVLNHLGTFGSEESPISESLNRTLEEDWYCDRDMPPYDRVTMDGIAVNYDEASILKELKIEGIAPAGRKRQVLRDTCNCIEVMTGAILPQNCDTVIRYEDLEISNGIAQVKSAYNRNQNIHIQGEDHKKGEKVVSAGICISPAEIGVGATIGKDLITVVSSPKTIIISTGDELVDIYQKPEGHQIRKSNVHRIHALLTTLGIMADKSHLCDNPEAITEKLKTYIKDYQLIILSGGVSKGKYDFLPDILERLQVEKYIHGVAQRPGKPMWFGKHNSGATVFALPGNPVSSFMCANVYLMPWIKKSLRQDHRDLPFGILQSEIIFKPNLEYFVVVKTSFNERGQILATPKKGSGSGDLSVLSHGDAFIKLPPEKQVFKVGEAYPLYFYRQCQ